MSKCLKIFFILISIITIFSSISFAETTNLYNEIENENDSEASFDADIDSEDEEDNSESQKSGTTVESGSMGTSTPKGMASTRKFC